MKSINNVRVVVLLLPALLIIMLCIDLKAMGCIEREREALLTFRHSLVDLSNRLSSWVGQDCCQWDGVRCNNVTGHVVKLDLRNSNRSGLYYDDCGKSCLEGSEVNPSITELKHLRYLDLSLNNFSYSQIPKFLGDFKSLRYLNLSYASFSGVVPPTLGNLSTLRGLDLGDSFSYLLNIDNLSWLSHLSALRFLSLRVNFTQTSSDLSHLLSSFPSLSYLDLSQCMIPEFPNALRNSTSLYANQNLSSLETLDLSFNFFIGVLPDLSSQLKNLKYLDLSGNFFSGLIPTSLSTFSALRYLDLSLNDLEGSIPESFCKLLALTFLQLSENLLNGSIPNSLGTSETLAEVDLSHNGLSGTIPKSLGTSETLAKVYLSHNGLSGTIPKSFGTSETLVVINLSYNKLSGSIPIYLVTSPALTRVALSVNQLSGSIPTFSSAARLEWLDLSSNQLSGSIPKSLGQLRNLTYLSLADNSLTGVVSEVHFENLFNLKVLNIGAKSLHFNVNSDWIPHFQLHTISLKSCSWGPRFPIWLKTQKTIKSISLVNANLSVSIPTWLVNLPITILDLSNNRICGPFPIFHGNNTIADLYLSNNSISGHILLNFKDTMPNLQTLVLSNNNITGAITAPFCEMSNLSILDLSNNHLSGGYPQNCWNGSTMQFLNIANNNLSGMIPRFVRGFSQLRSLHLSNNNFHGDFPLKLKDCQYLNVLDLSKNRFSGKIPSWIGLLSSLIILNLRSNKFDGILVPDLCNLSALRIVDLAQNNFSGTIPQCFKKFDGMKVGSTMEVYEKFNERLTQVVKGGELEYSKTLQFLINIDLSNNNLDGGIPEELLLLSGLNVLNLSNNHLRGYIPRNIGALKSLESLDLSKNELSGMIPESISKLSSISHLNLSCNNLWGRIPSGSQLDTFDSSTYTGNSLCGNPLENKCVQDSPPIVVNGDHDEGMEKVGFFISMVIGTIIGFWGVCGTLIFRKTLRYTYFRYVENAYDLLAVTIMVGVFRLQRYLGTKS